ncbi:D-alanine--D-alanine ligase [Flavobacteriaceae bacterium F08102]|nr:D-alanine--D-alanine ligase [Flavobacteriaceae bacterium F08102]
MARLKVFFTKLFYWEHWPTYMFYVPLIPYYIYQAIRSRHLVFYLAVNPGIKYSGNGTESKYKTLDLVPEKYKPKSILITPPTPIQTIQEQLTLTGISFPLIAKPDVGFRGFLVKKINSLDELVTYINQNQIPTILQEFIDYPQECGIFYYRIPGENTGKITSITLKKFLKVTGDGQHSIRELIIKDTRAFLYLTLLEKIHKDYLENILPKGEEIQLSVIGNHSKGTEFINGNHLITRELEQAMDAFSKQIDQWYYGRLDIKFHSFEELIRGEGFKVLEINGIISEPTHIYDASKSSYFTALMTLKKHWKLISTIARKNHLSYGVPYPAFTPYIKNMRWLRSYSKKLKQLNKLA